MNHLSQATRGLRLKKQRLERHLIWTEERGPEAEELAEKRNALQGWGCFCKCFWLLLLFIIHQLDKFSL